jgi:hypothetical protein
LRRSGSGGRRKNQTKTICLLSFEGESFAEKKRKKKKSD